MLELPTIPVNFVNNYGGLSYDLNEFRSDAGLSTRVARACRGFGWSFELSYEGLKPNEIGQLICWFDEIQLDYNTGLSLCSFRVPSSHPLWDKVSSKSYIEKLLNPNQTIDGARWVVTDPGLVGVPICNLHDIKFTIRNEYE